MPLYTPASTGFSTGTSFPSSPSTNQLFFRTDVGLLCYYDGTRWVTVDQFRQSFASVVAQPTSTSGVRTLVLAPQTDYGMYMIGLQAYTAVTTTNDGSHFWTIDCEFLDTNGSGTTATASFTTASDTVGKWTHHSVSLNEVLSASCVAIESYPTKTSTPGPLVVAMALTYRLVVT